jgi:toxin ParE1/3/4
MQVRWTEDAASDLQEIVAFIANFSPAAAQRVAKTIHDASESLASFPHRGRIGYEPATRELVLAGTGHIITYEVVRDAVFVLRIEHGSQQRPQR